VVLFDERPNPLVWIGIGLALLGVVFTDRVERTSQSGPSWFPIIIFMGTGACDVALNAVHHFLTNASNETVFPTICFAAAAIASLTWVLVGAERGALASGRTWIGGTTLGIINFASFYFLVRALSSSGLSSSTVFPLMSIGAILVSTIASIALFHERLNTVQWSGIALCVGALVLFMYQ
jgi:drug/metabolite transporter (DMT)-like permease